MARFTFRLPDIGEGIAEAEVVAWHVAIGDRIEEDSPVADMMTDKATVEMESPVSGVIVEMAGEVGDMIAIGSALVVIETDEASGDATGGSAGGSEGQAPAPATAEQPGASAKADPAPAGSVETAVARNTAPVAAPEANRAELRPTPADTAPVEEGKSLGHSGARRILSSPAVRARARDLGIDLADLRPAEGDRLRHADLDAYLRYQGGQGYGGARPAAPDQPVKVVGLRRRIAENMAAAKRSIPHFTYVDEIEVTQFEAMRESLNHNRGDRPKLTMLPMLIVALCRTLPEFPMLNARYDDEAGVVTRHGAVHLGMATQTPAGLMVPVIRDAQAKNVWQLAREITRLAEAARNGSARSEELSGSTISVTSLGPLGGVATTPVINRPEVAIIGPNKIVERPVFADATGDRLRRAKFMNLSISCDHRVVDGWDAASFVQALKRRIEHPVLLFAD